MASVTLEELAMRVEKLEQTVTRLLGDRKPEPVEFKDWRKAVEYAASQPPPDPEFMKAFEEAIRERREAAQREAEEEADREDQARGGTA
jgi:hypothetical protein